MPSLSCNTYPCHLRLRFHLCNHVSLYFCHLDHNTILSSHIQKTPAQSLKVSVGQRVKSTPKFSVSKLSSITKLHHTDLIITVHHFQSPTRLLFFHMPQGTLQAEDNIFVLLYDLYKNAGVWGRSAISPKL